MTYATPQGKEIEIVSAGRNRRIQFKGGGELPAELQGEWTSIPDAERAIHIYLLKKNKPKRVLSKVKKKDASQPSG